jgi:hypothetical protein
MLESGRQSSKQKKRKGEREMMFLNGPDSRPRDKGEGYMISSPNIY